MTTKQPQWRFVANLGDATPLEYGGDFLYVDASNVYPPELVHIEEPNSKGEYRVSRIILEPCFWNPETETLSDNRFHTNKSAWFARDLARVASCFGMEVEDLRPLLLSSDPMERAQGYLALTGYFGWHEFDSYPNIETRSEIRRRYRAAFR